MNDHTIFTTFGVQHQCLELSVQCSAARRIKKSTSSVVKHKQVLQLNIRCDHYVATYEARFKKNHKCYEIYLEHMEHLLWMKKFRSCKIPYARSHQLEGDGHKYLLLSRCLKEVKSQGTGNIAYWLFVNKRNTPEQNRKIIRKLSLPKALYPQSYVQSANANLPLVNRSTNGAFETDYLASIIYKPLEEKFSHLHTLFVIPGIRPQCMELSVRCGSHLKHSNNTSVRFNRTQMIQLSFRCDHFIVKYLMYYQNPVVCYLITLDRMNHKMSGDQVDACNVGKIRPCQLLGDGHHYLLLLYCFKHVNEHEHGNIAYWLFVNKRNTPEQNRKIMQQLSLPKAMHKMADDNDRTDANGKLVCRCDIYERYMYEIKQCHRPFKLPTSEETLLKWKNYSTPDITVKIPSVSASGRMTNVQWNWFLVKCVLIVGAFLTVSYALYMQLRRHVEEQLTDVPVKTDTVKIKFIKVQESVESDS
uniref:Uncharacterized protein n=1 Tax=Anopheles culicifacies TaxID=139723 RepID=A0A182LU75_9DIPT